VALAIVAALAVGGAGAALAVGVEDGAPAQSKDVQHAGGKAYVFHSVPASDGAQVKAKCPRGTHVAGGGAGADNGGADVNESVPFDGGDSDGATDDGWSAYFNDTLDAGNIRVYAICE
jgi:hypothetical protein